MSLHDDQRSDDASPTRVTRLGSRGYADQHSELRKKKDQLLTLTDGRRLGYSEYGTSDGTPVFFFHGLPGSRLSWPAFDPSDVAAKLKARIIAVDRPGYGISDAKRGRTLLQWPDDVVELADALSLDKFAVLGASGGGPYALSCAFKIPERLTKTVVVCGMGPAMAPGIKEGTSWLFPGMPVIVRWPMLTLMAMVVRNWPESFAKQMKGALSRPDQELLQAHPELATMMVAEGYSKRRSGYRITTIDALRVSW
jgi:pimeloyl-ACP methyl ester carboxylesterase